MANRFNQGHISADGAARMVDVGDKPLSRREARAEVWVNIGTEIAQRLQETGSAAKGNVLETARLAGITAAKKTADLIPMCHPLPLDVVEVSAVLEGPRVHIETRAASQGKTGVEMEALTAASVAALTIYDMVKSEGKGIEIGPLRLLEKSGGKSGTWRRAEEKNSGT